MHGACHRSNRFKSSFDLHLLILNNISNSFDFLLRINHTASTLPKAAGCLRGETRATL